MHCGTSAAALLWTRMAIRFHRVVARSTMFTMRVALPKSWAFVHVLNLEREFERDVVEPFFRAISTAKRRFPASPATAG